ncbi:hypothetical protein AM305_05152 [Actinobacillus minor NM305]|uniref:Uncharacterized protein n=1 Tax=Actinobacillus minor NM305 TaxID=637911 RepID=C5RZD6_9PAST|nr:hypothetical protein AM305_05152 [Actinobacillus minor NM305]
MSLFVYAKREGFEAGIILKIMGFKMLGKPNSYLEK